MTLAKAGADIIAVDICADIENVKYPLASWPIWTKRRRLVEKQDRRCVHRSQADVREPTQAAPRPIDGGVSELGRLDIVVANAGIGAMGPTLPAARSSTRSTSTSSAWSTW